MAPQRKEINMTKQNCLGILLSLLLILPVASHAQVGVYFGPHLGFQKIQDQDGTNHLVGATMRIKLLSALAAEGSISYRQEDFDNSAITVKSWPVTVSGLLYPLPIIYGGVGGGWYNTTFDFDQVYNVAGFDDRTEQEFGWHLAAGLELPVSPDVSLFGDVRWVFLDQKFENLPDVIIDDISADFHSINAGLLFNL